MFFYIIHLPETSRARAYLYSSLALALSEIPSTCDRATVALVGASSPTICIVTAASSTITAFQREKATELTESEWPSSVCSVSSVAFQFSCTFVFIWIQGWINFSNCLRTMLFSGATISVEQYRCRGACSIINRLCKAKRFASLINACKLELSSS
jgi:hypothetical protein